MGEAERRYWRLQNAKSRSERSRCWFGYVVDHPLGNLTWNVIAWELTLHVPLLDEELLVDVQVHPLPEFVDEEPPPVPGIWAYDLWNAFMSEWPRSRWEEAVDCLHAALPAIHQEWYRSVGYGVANELNDRALKEIERREAIAKSRDLFLATLEPIDCGLCQEKGRQWLEIGFESDFDTHAGLLLRYVPGEPALQADSGDEFWPLI